MNASSMLLPVLCALVACGDDSSSDPEPVDAAQVPIDATLDAAVDAPPMLCRRGGEIAGTVAGQTFSQVSTTIGFELGGGAEIAIVEEPASCEAAPASGEFLDLQLCGMEAGTYQLQSANPNCAANPQSGTAFMISGSEWTIATGGTVTITSAGGGCASGSFDVRFAGGEALTGTFDVVLCR